MQLFVWSLKHKLSYIINMDQINLILSDSKAWINFFVVVPNAIGSLCMSSKVPFLVFHLFYFYCYWIEALFKF